MIENVVTGASGFIGSHLVKKLTGETVTLRVQGSSGFPACKRMFFLSTYGNMSSHINCYEMVRANVWDLMRVTGYSEWFCYMSSSSVTLPVQTPYSRTKRAAEEILQALPELKSCIVRPYSVTGVNEQREHLIPTLIRSCMEGEEMFLDANPVHDFIDVEDVVDALIYCADNQITGIIHLGSCHPTPNYVVRELVEHFCQKKANVIPKSGLRMYDTEEWFCRNKPDWFTPKKTIANSIEEMVEAYKDGHGR